MSEESTSFFQFSMNMHPELFELLCTSYLHNEESDAGTYNSDEIKATLTAENLDITYTKSSDVRTVNFAGLYTIPALPEPFTTVFAGIVNIKALARKMRAGGLPWNSAVDSALNMSAIRRGGWQA